MKLIDTHAHYDDSRFDEDRFQVLDRLFDSNVLAIINMGCDIKSSEKSLEMAQRYENMFAAVGVHPEEVNEVAEDYLARIEQLAANKKAVAIGEIGLDYHYDGFDREKQIRIFREQLILAGKLDLPVVIHSRDATEDTMTILHEITPKKAVMHCYSGSAETAKELLKLGLYISFTGVITFKNSKKALNALEVVPMDRLLLETDCPYMAPVPCRGERCDSGLIQHTAAKIGELKGFSTDEIIEKCNKNAISFFNLNIK